MGGRPPFLPPLSSVIPSLRFITYKLVSVESRRTGIWKIPIPASMTSSVSSYPSSPSRQFLVHLARRLTFQSTLNQQRTLDNKSLRSVSPFSYTFQFLSHKCLNKILLSNTKFPDLFLHHSKTNTRLHHYGIFTFQRCPQLRN
jgi:hypothetical protein